MSASDQLQTRLLQLLEQAAPKPVTSVPNIPSVPNVSSVSPLQALPTLPAVYKPISKTQTCGDGMLFLLILLVGIGIGFASASLVCSRSTS